MHKGMNVLKCHLLLRLGKPEELFYLRQLGGRIYKKEDGSVLDHPPFY